MKTLLILLLLIPSLSWGKVLERFICVNNIEETDEIDISLYFRYEDYFSNELGMKYSYWEDNDFYHLHIFETINFEDLNWLQSIPKKGGPVQFKYLDFTEHNTKCKEGNVIEE